MYSMTAPSFSMKATVKFGDGWKGSRITSSARTGSSVGDLSDLMREHGIPETRRGLDLHEDVMRKWRASGGDYGITVVSMKNDWRTVFEPDGKPMAA